MRVTFDSNVWETIFNPIEGGCSALRAVSRTGASKALSARRRFELRPFAGSQRASTLPSLQ